MSGQPFFATAALLLVLAPASAEAATSAFDGRWSVAVSCETAPDGASGYRWTFPASVSGGVMRGQYNTPGQSPSATLGGSIAASGAATLTVRGITGVPEYAVGRVRAGTPFRYTVKAQFDANSGAGERLELRRCTLSFSKT